MAEQFATGILKRMPEGILVSCRMGVHRLVGTLEMFIPKILSLSTFLGEL